MRPTPESSKRGSGEAGGTSCKLPFATEVIGKVENAGKIGRKRKTIKC
jgi:hypothetical protein